MRIGRCLIDANWGQSTDVVYQFCRQSTHSAVIIPSHGRFVGASSLPFSEYRRRPGDRVGLNWRIPNVAGKRAIRHVVYDTNWWKSFINARLQVAMGDRGCLSLFGTNAETHRMLAEQLTSEYFVKTEARGRASTNGTATRAAGQPLVRLPWWVPLSRPRCREPFYLERSQHAKYPQNA